MVKKLITLAFAISVCGLHAQEMMEPIIPIDVTPEVKYVGKAATDGMSAAKSRQIQNICIAAGAVAIAVTTLVLVSRHHHHHHHHHHHKTSE